MANDEKTPGVAQVRQEDYQAASELILDIIEGISSRGDVMPRRYDLVQRASSEIGIPGVVALKSLILLESSRQADLQRLGYRQSV